MSIPKKHHYLPQFFIQRWVDAEGRVIEYRRPNEELVHRRKHPAQTAYLTELYADESKTNPIERQALEMVFMQKVDDKAATALAYIEEHKTKPADPQLRDGWSRFLMSMVHRSPERVKYLTEKVQEYEDGKVNPRLQDEYVSLRGPDEPPNYEDWLKQQGPITPELKVKLLRLLIDSPRIGETLNAMHWCVYTLEYPRFGFLTGDHPIMLSNGIGHKAGFVVLAISPRRLFVAAHDQEVIKAFTSQRANALERAINDACVQQSRHVIVAHNDSQKVFVDRRFLQNQVSAGPNGLFSWKSPLAFFPTH